MTALSVDSPFPIFTDIDGTPLEGYIIVGKANQDPQTSPISVGWDASLATPAVQPIQTMDGYPIMSGGKPGRLYINEDDYSIAIYDKNKKLLYSAPTATQRISSVLISSAASSRVTFTQSGAGATLQTAADIFTRTVSVADYGAVGNDSQVLIPTSYTTDVVGAPTTITQQTKDAVAINNAIRFLRVVGGGRLRFPKGIYRIYGYLERIDFPCLIEGDGVDITVLKNCDGSPTNTHGYGVFCIDPSQLSSVSFHGLTIDGNAVARAKPTGEFRSYPLAIYGSVAVKISDLKAINSPIDCLFANFDNTQSSSMQVANCTFENSFRNTVSLVSGWNQSFVNCDITGGGKVHGGINPRYCLDIEPNSSSASIKNIRFTNCRFAIAENVIVGGVWCEAKFVNCEFDAIGSSKSGLGYPWAFCFGQAQISLIGCALRGDPSHMGTIAVCYPTNVAGVYKDTQYTKIIGCEFFGCGIHAVGRRTFIENTTFLNSRYPVLVESAASFRHELYVNNITLINVFDCFNAGTGACSSFAIMGTVEGPVIINGLSVIVDPVTLPTSPSFAANLVYGIHLNPAGLSNAEMKVSNVHISGFYKKYPNATAQALNASSFRDWGLPNLPPADTAGQAAGPGVVFYRNCTGYGNNL